MSLDIAFRPESHWAYTRGTGTAGTLWAPVPLKVPPTLFKRRLWAWFDLSPAGGNFRFKGRLVCSLNGRSMGEIPVNKGGLSGASIQHFFGFTGTQPVMENALSITTTTPETFHLPPFELLVSCDTIEFIQDSDSTSNSGTPVWFFACLSMSAW